MLASSSLVSNPESAELFQTADLDGFSKNVELSLWTLWLLLSPPPPTCSLNIIALTVRKGGASVFVLFCFLFFFLGPNGVIGRLPS